MCTNTYIYTRTHIPAHTHTYIWPKLHTYTCTCAQTRTHMYAHTSTNTSHTRPKLYMFTYKCTCAQIPAYACMHTHTHITHTCNIPSEPQSRWGWCRSAQAEEEWSATAASSCLPLLPGPLVSFPALSHSATHHWRSVKMPLRQPSDHPRSLQQQRPFLWSGICSTVHLEGFFFSIYFPIPYTKSVGKRSTYRILHKSSKFCELFWFVFFLLFFVTSHFMHFYVFFSSLPFLHNRNSCCSRIITNDEAVMGTYIFPPQWQRCQGQHGWQCCSSHHNIQSVCTKTTTTINNIQSVCTKPTTTTINNIQFVCTKPTTKIKFKWNWTLVMLFFPHWDANSLLIHIQNRTVTFGLTLPSP